MSESRTTKTRAPVTERATAAAVKLAIPSRNVRMDTMVLERLPTYRRSMSLLKVDVEEGGRGELMSRGKSHVISLSHVITAASQTQPYTLYIYPYIARPRLAHIRSNSTRL